MKRELLIKRLKKTEYWCEKTSAKERYINQLTCPVCGEPEAYIDITSPWTTFCNRRSKCGAHIPLKEILPPLCFEKKYPPTKDDLHRPAREYLKQERCLTNDTLQSVEFEYWPNVRDTGIGAVMFPLEKKEERLTAYNGRLLKDRKGVDKSHNKGKISNKLFKHPNTDHSKRCVIVEGIIDALSIHQMGEPAIAILAAGASPKQLHDLPESKDYVLAFDADEAGRKARKRWTRYLEDKGCKVAQWELPSYIGDWNDLLRYQKQPATWLEQNQKELEFSGNLSTAETPWKYAEIHLSHKGYAPRVFEFRRATYTSWEGRNSDGATIIAGVHKVIGATIKPLFYTTEKSDTGDLIHKYRVEVTPERGKVIECTLTAEELQSIPAFVGAVARKAAVNSDPIRNSLPPIRDKILGKEKLPRARKVNAVGHDPESDCVITQHYAITPEGKTVLPSNGLFRLPHNRYVFPPEVKMIKPVKHNKIPDIIRDFHTAFGTRGATALGFLFMCWFKHTILEKIGHFPYFIPYGPKNTGKSSLTETLQGFQGFPGEEGITMSRKNTAKGVDRALAQRSDLMQALLEANQSNYFDFESLLSPYNGGMLSIRAAYTNDNTVKELPLTCGLMAVQNAALSGSAALKQRFVPVYFPENTFTAASRQALGFLTQSISPAERAYLHVAVMRHRKTIESKWYDGYCKSLKVMHAAHPTERLASHYALLSTFYRLVIDILLSR